MPTGIHSLVKVLGVVDVANQVALHRQVHEVKATSQVQRARQDPVVQLGRVVGVRWVPKRGRVVRQAQLVKLAKVVSVVMVARATQQVRILFQVRVPIRAEAVGRRVLEGSVRPNPAATEALANRRVVQGRDRGQVPRVRQVQVVRHPKVMIGSLAELLHMNQSLVLQNHRVVTAEAIIKGILRGHPQVGSLEEGLIEVF